MQFVNYLVRLGEYLHLSLFRNFLIVLFQQWIFMKMNNQKFLNRFIKKNIFELQILFLLDVFAFWSDCLVVFQYEHLKY